jgi:dTDP-glucose 4,6-dehydratase
MLFKENSKLSPSSPYSASKAACDHIAESFLKTYNLKICILRLTNNYGPFQFPEKLIPLMILNALEHRKLPVYGKGNQIRDWLHVNDHVRALWLIARKGKVGETYNIGGGNQIKNINVVKKICWYLDNCKKIKDHKNSYSRLIAFVKDRPGHDTRYGINFSKLKKNLNWKPLYNFDQGLKETVMWYLKNKTWCKKIIKKNSIHKKRLGAI